ncbi:MAG: TetR/AcrR family transcriptional regulator [Armatimonadetes bacterium]|nr:TetR/AcrR family transcriptional regulator [Armatimonadota bacterium]
MTTVLRTPPHNDRATRARILKAAASLFRQKGFKATSMREIAQAVGVGKSSLYHHFSNKQTLLFEILAYTVDRAVCGLREIALSDRPAAARLRAAVAHHIINLIEDRDNVACFIEEGRALAPEHRQAYVARRDEYEYYFRRIVEDGIARGEFSSTNVRLAGFAVLGMANWVVRWYHPDGRLSGTEIANHFGDFAVRALTRPAGNARSGEDAASGALAVGTAGGSGATRWTGGGEVTGP